MGHEVGLCIDPPGGDALAVEVSAHRALISRLNRFYIVERHRFAVGAEDVYIGIGCQD